MTKSRQDRGITAVLPGMFDAGVATLPPSEAVNERRDDAIRRVAERAEENREGFLDDASAFVLNYLQQHGPTAGEVLTVACKNAGIKPHDDRAFGAVYLRLVRRGQIERVGTVRRERGHGTAGGNVWGLVRR